MAVFLLPILGGVASALRLPALAAWMGGLFAQLVAFLSGSMSVRLAMQLAIIAAVIGLTVAALLTIKTILFSISFVVPTQVFQAMSMIVPDNLPACFSAIASAHVVRWVWTWQVYAIEKAGIS